MPSHNVRRCEKKANYICYSDLPLLTLWRNKYIEYLCIHSANPIYILLRTPRHDNQDTRRSSFCSSVSSSRFRLEVSQSGDWQSAILFSSRRLDMQIYLCITLLGAVSFTKRRAAKLQGYMGEGQAEEMLCCFSVASTEDLSISSKLGQAICTAMIFRRFLNKY